MLMAVPFDVRKFCVAVYRVLLVEYAGGILAEVA